MTTVNIIHKFTFQHNNGQFQEFNPGSYDLPDELAEHLYIRAHSDDPIQVAPAPGTREAALLAAQQRERSKVLKAAAEVAADPEADNEVREAALKVTQKRQKLKE